MRKLDKFVAYVTSTVLYVALSLYATNHGAAFFADYFDDLIELIH